MDGTGEKGEEIAAADAEAWQATIEGWHSDLEELKDELVADALSTKLAEESTRSAAQVLTKEEKTGDQVRQLDVEIQELQNRLRSLAGELEQLRHAREERLRRVRDREQR